MSDELPLVLVVEDEPNLADLYATWLSKEYCVETAYSGHEALDVLDEEVTVVLLDRRMPGLSGDEVLAVVRKRDIDCHVAMVTAVEPDFDIVEMGFDAYVTKPPDREELSATVERLIERAALDDDLQEYYSLVARRSALQAEKSSGELKRNDEYADLLSRIEAKREDVDESIGDMASDTNFVGAVREIVGEDDHPSDDSHLEQNNR